jgi:hypothetical protein
MTWNFHRSKSTILKSCETNTSVRRFRYDADPRSAEMELQRLLKADFVDLEQLEAKLGPPGFEPGTNRL